MRRRKNLLRRSTPRKILGRVSRNPWRNKILRKILVRVRKNQ